MELDCVKTTQSWKGPVSLQSTWKQGSEGLPRQWSGKHHRFYISVMTSDGIASHLGQQHEDHVAVVLTEEPHHLLVQLYELRRRSIGSKERRQKRAEPSVLQNGLQHSSAF